MDTHELAWAAGFFDGEGTFCTNKSPHGFPKVRCSVEQADTITLKRFCNALGFGKIGGERKRFATRRTTYSVTLAQFELAQAALAMMWPWLSRPKRMQAVTTFRRAAEFRALRDKRLLETRCAPLVECVRGHKAVPANLDTNAAFRCRECETIRMTKWREDHPGYYRSEAKRNRAARRVSRKVLQEV